LKIEIKFEKMSPFTEWTCQDCPDFAEAISGLEKHLRKLEAEKQDLQVKFFQGPILQNSITVKNMLDKI
jgi:hypothetical protein